MTPSFEPWSCVTLLALVLGSLSCGHGRMLPAPEAERVPGAPASAVAEEGGLRISASGDDWQGRPKDLPRRLTPVKVRIANHSGRPVRILYQDFELAGAKGRVYRPLPVVPLDHASDGEPEVVLQPMFGAANFFVGPRYRDVYPSLPAWSRPLPRDSDFYERQFGRWAKNLPTEEMQRMALPEGVLEDGGRIAGFIYFEEATGRERHLVLRANLEPEAEGETAAIEIPFRVE
jgi:hypothetical protein